MSVEYDFIVIGSSTAGIYAAVAAAHLNARVALVETEPLQTNWLSSSAIYSQAFTHVGRIAQQVRDAAQLGIHLATDEASSQQQVSAIHVDEAMQWAQAVISLRSQQYSSAVLSALGVDVVTGRGEFCRRPHLGFIVNNRCLRGRAYLIATGSVPIVPEIEGLQALSYRTPEEIWHLTREVIESGNAREQESGRTSPHQLQGSWVVIGGSPTGAALAQTLVRLNCEVTLVVEESHILPKEDPEAARLVQAQLEAEGVRVLTASPVIQVQQIEGKKWVQAGNRAIETDEILIATGEQPHIAALNLEGVGVKFTRYGLELNEKLQTTNPRIYACGGSVGGYPCSHVAQYEASIALKNALFAPLFKVNYLGIPWVILTDPQVAQVGLTEVQARQRYGKDVFVVRQYFKTVDKAQILGETTGFCKIVALQNGQLLGASIVGPEASELIGLLALAIRQKLKVKALAELPHASPTLSEIIQKTALEWQGQRLKQNKRLQNFLEGFFNLRRKWSS